MGRTPIVSLALLLTGCIGLYLEAGAGVVAGAVEPEPLGVGPALSLGVGWEFDYPRTEGGLAFAFGATAEAAPLGFERFDDFAIANGLQLTLAVPIAELSYLSDYLRWTAVVGLGGGGVRLREQMYGAATGTVFTGLQYQHYYGETQNTFSVALGAYALLLTQPGALVGGQVRVRVAPFL